MKSDGLDVWRNNFRTLNSNVFDIIENAIKVAASDCPDEFLARRSRMVETLFLCKSTCLKCGFDGVKCNQNRVNSSNDECLEMNTNQISNYSYGEAEALTDEIEEETQILGEVLRIEGVLFNFEDQSEGALFECLRKLQLMFLTVDILKATDIGKAVGCLRKNGSKKIRNLAWTLVDGWKDMVDEWENATGIIITEGTQESVNPSVVDYEDEGLLSPPLDDGIFFPTQPPTAMELSQFFDGIGMDDDGNIRNNEESVQSSVNQRKALGLKLSVGNLVSRGSTGRSMKKQVEDNLTPNRPLNAAQSGPTRLVKPGMIKTKCSENQVKATVVQQDVNRAYEVKLEATKRKVQERYQQAENAKRQRTIQVVELHDIPMRGLGHKNPYIKSENHNRRLLAKESF